MSLEIQSFAGQGDHDKERLVLRAKTNLDVGEYAVFVSSSTPDGRAVSGKKTAFWFPDVEVNAGDLVVLYTKQGKQSTKQGVSGVTIHFFYWGISKTIWNTPKVGAVVLHVLNWKWKQLGD